MFLVNSRYRHFSAALSGSASKLLHLPGHTFSLSYGVILPSSLTRVLSSALGCSPHPPESVYGTDAECSPREAFLESMGSTSFGCSEELPPHHLSALMSLRLSPTRPGRTAYRFEPPYHNAAGLPFSVPSRFNEHPPVQEY